MAVLVEKLEAHYLQQHARQNEVVLCAYANKENVPGIQGKLAAKTRSSTVNDTLLM
jgi:hypothetical protein